MVEKSRVAVEGTDQYLVDFYARLVGNLGYDARSSKTSNLKSYFGVLITEPVEGIVKRISDLSPDLLLLTNLRGYDLFLKSYDVNLNGLPLIIVSSAKDLFLPKSAHFLYRDCSPDHREKLDDLIKSALVKN